MNNIYIKEKINKLNENTKEVLDTVISDSLLEIAYRERLNKETLERIAFVYLSLFTEKNHLEYSELKTVEKNILCRIISKGIASIYVDDEYITNENAKDKLIIIEDLINLLCILTGYNKSTIKILIRKDIKIYFYYGWKWDFI